MFGYRGKVQKGNGVIYLIVEEVLDLTTGLSVSQDKIVRFRCKPGGEMRPMAEIAGQTAGRQKGPAHQTPRYVGPRTSHRQAQGEKQEFSVKTMDATTTQPIINAIWAPKNRLGLGLLEIFA
jgi:hypothetical protein